MYPTFLKDCSEKRSPIQETIVGRQRFENPQVDLGSGSKNVVLKTYSWRRGRRRDNPRDAIYNG